MRKIARSQNASEAVLARARLDAAFAAEERRGLMLASGARSAAAFVVVAWLAVVNPNEGAAWAWVVGTAALFLVTGLAQLWLYWRAIVPPAAPYVFVLVDSLMLAAVLLCPNPFVTVPVPPAMPLRFANFLYFFVVLMQMAFSFRPRLLLWSTLCGIAAWSMGFAWVMKQPGIVTDPPGADTGERLVRYFLPNYVSHLKFQTEIVVFLVVGVGLALLVRRSRDLVTERAEAERARGNLSRYFSPKVVEDGWKRKSSGTAAAWRSSSATPFSRRSESRMSARTTPATPSPARGGCSRR